MSGYAAKVPVIGFGAIRVEGPTPTATQARASLEAFGLVISAPKVTRGLGKHRHTAAHTLGARQAPLCLQG